ncbi:MAG: His/Gly/Thr/Pro-type tRNA ligase C-terminal domain-containing protein [Candidatus Saccharimonadaceae bacterium]|nr:His/Gly/Thr/Pro-type tRNA ligase C-terminal domain-containing protein [Candidatus Saccharimonadaceae bacterium]
MRVSNLFTRTSKTAPADDVAINAQLLTRAGYIHKEIAGVYAYLPMGLRVLEKIKSIVREEMNAVGGQEVMMTVLQPKDIWEKTDRWDDKKVDNWFKTKLVNGTELGVGLTHEEPIVDAVSNFVNSYKDLPFSVYQIQSKFRNELRAKSGLLRGREFVMKDMYTLSRNQDQHIQEYEKIVAAYFKVYDRLGIGDITYRTYADGGIFTPRFSDEFQTVSEVGEDVIYLDESKRIAINAEIMNDENLAKLGLERNNLVEKRGIEVGNTFHLESKYTDALDLYYADENGTRQSIIMGCYGIGVSRLMGVIAEIFSDSKGLVWPENIAPYKVYLVRIGNEEVVKCADGLYEEFSSKGIEVLYDDRDVHAGQKFADSELIGIPYRVTVSDRLMADGNYELVERKDGQIKLLTREQLLVKLS